jgi:hypothetical protein
MKNSSIAGQLKMQEKEIVFAVEKKNIVDAPDINTSVQQQISTSANHSNNR